MRTFASPGRCGSWQRAGRGTRTSSAAGAVERAVGTPREGGWHAYSRAEARGRFLRLASLDRHTSPNHPLWHTRRRSAATSLLSATRVQSRVRHTGHRSSLRWPRAWRSCGAAAAAMAAFRRSRDPHLLESAVAPRPVLPDGRPRGAPRPRLLRDPTRARLRVRRHRPPAASHPWRAIAITELLLDSTPE